MWVRPDDIRTDVAAFLWDVCDTLLLLLLLKTRSAPRGSNKGPGTGAGRQVDPLPFLGNSCRD